MKLEQFLKPNDNPFFKIVASLKDLYDQFADLVTESKGSLEVKFLRGPKCADRSGFFDECASALQFPFYFGENWDSFHDCLGDMSGQDKTGLILVIVDASCFLEHPKDAFATFEETITEVATRWAKPSKARDAKTLNVIYHGEPKEEKMLNARFQSLPKLD